MAIRDGEAHDFLQEAIKAKEHQWYEHQNRDLSPQMVFLSDHGQAFVFPAWGWAAVAGVPGAIKKMEGIFMSDPDHFARLEQVWLATDGYSRTIPEDGDPPSHGELEKDFQTNPASDVTEMLTVTIAADDLCGGVEFQQLLAPYTITDGGRIEWGETTSPVECHGAVADAIRSLFKARSEA